MVSLRRLASDGQGNQLQSGERLKGGGVTMTKSSAAALTFDHP